MFGKHNRKTVRAGVYKLSGKVVATQDHDPGDTGILVVARVHVNNVKYLDSTRDGLVKEIALAPDQFVICPAHLDQEVGGYLAQLEEAEAAAAQDAADADGE